MMKMMMTIMMMMMMMTLCEEMYMFESCIQREVNAYLAGVHCRKVSY